MNPTENLKCCDHRNADTQEKHSAEGNADLHQGIRPKARRDEPPIHVERRNEETPSATLPSTAANLGDWSAGKSQRTNSPQIP